MKSKGGACATKCALLGTKVAVLGMCNNNSGLDSRRIIFEAIHMARFYHEGRAKSRRRLELQNIVD